MKKTLDSNVFIYSILSKICSEIINELVSNHYNHIILSSIKEECIDKLEELFMIFSVLNSEYNLSTDMANLLKSKRYSKFQSDYPQLHKILLKYIESGYFTKDKRFDEYKVFLESLRIHISKIIKLFHEEKYLFPVTREDYENLIENPKFKTLLSKMDFIKNNDKDKNHLGLCDAYIKQSKNELKFVTVDNEDIIKNKNLIEKIISQLVIEEVNIRRRVKLVDPTSEHQGCHQLFLVTERSR